MTLEIENRYIPYIQWARKEYPLLDVEGRWFGSNYGIFFSNGRHEKCLHAKSKVTISDSVNGKRLPWDVDISTHCRQDEIFNAMRKIADNMPIPVYRRVVRWIKKLIKVYTSKGGPAHV